jgi:hypothetical protein
MNGESPKTSRSSVAAISFVVLATALAAPAAFGEQLPETAAPVEAANSAPLPQSALDDSYRYHHFGELPEYAPHQAASPARQGGWYRYGFPVQSHRWGWFGAEHYYPRVLWHRGYYGDHCRWSYRRGY